MSSNRRGANNRAVTIAEAASILGTSRHTIRRLISAGRIPAVPLRTGKQPPLVVRRKDVERLRDWVNAETQLAALPPADLPEHRRPDGPQPQVPPDDPRLQVPDSIRVRREANRILAQLHREASA